MNFSRIYAIFIRQLFVIRHNPARLVGIFLWIALDMVLWGFITRYLDAAGQSLFSFATTILGAIILWGFFIRIQQGVMTAFLEDIWSKNFMNFFASPLKTGEYIGGLILYSILFGVLGLAMMILIAGIGFGYNILIVGLHLFPFLAVLVIFGIALGIFVSAIVFRFGPSAEWLAWPLIFALSPFIGIYYPISTLPFW